jgi:hypothetical protein
MTFVSKLYILFALLTLSAAHVHCQMTPEGLVAEFESRAKDYTKERERLERGLPALPKKATPEEVMAHKEKLTAAVLQFRENAQQGDIFTPLISQHLRKLIAVQLDGPDRVKLRKAVFEAENKAVRKRVNHPYPESQEIMEMPPTLLAALPQLPKQLKYRFVGRDLLLVDRENLLIIDFMTNAVP